MTAPDLSRAARKPGQGRDTQAADPKGCPGCPGCPGRNPSGRGTRLQREGLAAPARVRTKPELCIYTRDTRDSRDSAPGLGCVVPGLSRVSRMPGTNRVRMGAIALNSPPQPRRAIPMASGEAHARLPAIGTPQEDPAGISGTAAATAALICPPVPTTTARVAARGMRTAPAPAPAACEPGCG